MQTAEEARNAVVNKLYEVADVIEGAVCLDYNVDDEDFNAEGETQLTITVQLVSV